MSLPQKKAKRIEAVVKWSVVFLFWLGLLGEIWGYYMEETLSAFPTLTGLNRQC